MSKYDSVWILELWRHIDGFMRCIHLGWTKYDIIDGLGVKYTGRHCDKCYPPWHASPHLMPQTQTTTRPWTFFLPSGCCVYVMLRCCHQLDRSSFSPESACASSPALISSLGSVQILREGRTSLSIFHGPGTFQRLRRAATSWTPKSPECEGARGEVGPHLKHQSLGAH